MEHTKEFKALPLKFSAETASPHTIFVKEHSVRLQEQNKPPGRTLFVINVPPYATEAGLKTAFSPAGKTQSVIIQKSVSNAPGDLQTGFKIAYIIFMKPGNLQRALKLNDLRPMSTEARPVLTGVSKWMNEYNARIYDQEELSAEVKAFIANYDKVEDKKKTEAPVDDDGWTVVTKKGRNPGIARKQSVSNRIIQKNKLKSKRKELKNFYTFQLKEQKMKNIIALRKSFEESKEKINLMKKMRNFKPF